MNDIIEPTYSGLIDLWDRTDADDAQALHSIGEGLVGAVQALQKAADDRRAAIVELVAERDKARGEVVNAVNNYVTCSFERDRLADSRAERDEQMRTYRRERDALQGQLDKVREALDEYREHTLPGVWLAMRLADVAEWEQGA